MTLLTRLNDPLQLGHLLKARRLARGLTLEDVQEKTGIHPSTLSEWENGRHTPRLDRLMVLLPLYGEEIAFLDVSTLNEPLGGEGNDDNGSGTGQQGR